MHKFREKAKEIEMAENKKAKPRIKKGLWKPEEDLILKTYVETHGEGNWATVSQKSGLMRGGKSCRLRWKNYLRPNIKRGRMSQEEEDLIIRMHKLIGNRWSLIAGRLPGRTDNEVKNYWNTHLNKTFRPVKTKSTDSNTCQNGNNDDNRNKRQGNLQPSSGASTMSISEDLNGQKDREESNDVAGTSIEEPKTNTIGYCNESPVAPANNYGFVFDDEPLLAYLDSLVLFESFGYNGLETFT